MRIVDFQCEPIAEFRFLNAGRGPGQFYEDTLPIHHARVDRLPEGVEAVIATADLQGRERFQESNEGPLRLLGEVLPGRLVEEVLPPIGIYDPDCVGALLAGDFYTVPALDRRGGSGDVSPVWSTFGNQFAWVAGVAGNHDTFGIDPLARPRFPSGVNYLDGDAVDIGRIRFGGVGGIIGNPAKLHRRDEESYLFALEQVMEQAPDVLLLHDGPAGVESGQRGSSRVRDVLEKVHPRLVVRGHAHWRESFAQFANGLQVLNVDARVVILTRQ